MTPVERNNAEALMAYLANGGRLNAGNTYYTARCVTKIEVEGKGYRIFDGRGRGLYAFAGEYGSLFYA